MHRVVLGLSDGPRQGDHINHNTLDNQKCNLRVVTHRQNHENMRNQSKYGVGIALNKRSTKKPYRAHARVDGKDTHIGCFASIEEAVAARTVFLIEKGLDSL